MHLPRLLAALLTSAALCAAVFASPATAQTSLATSLSEQATSLAAGTTSYTGKIGISTHMRYFPQSTTRYQLQRISASGIKWIREDFIWSQTEATRGVYDWSLPDNLMAAAASAEVDVLPIIGQTPRWASSDPSGQGGSTWPPRDNADYARFVSAVVARYGRNGTFWRANPGYKARPLKAIQLWNEPWGFFSWKPEPNPAGYAALARAGSNAAHQRDSAIKIVVGDVLQSRTDKSVRPWLRELLAADPRIGEIVDAWGVAVYPGPRWQGPYDTVSRPEWNFGRVQMVRDITVGAGAAKPIWLTEIGWSTGVSGSERIDEATQARFVREAATRAVQEWGSFVERSFFYSFDRPNDTDGFKFYGLRRQDDSVSPAYRVLSDLSLYGTTYPSSNIRPVASFKSTATTIQAWDKFTVTSRSYDPDGQITSTVWDLDSDGYYDDEWRPQADRVFRYPGIYPIRLRVTDKRGAVSTAVYYMNVIKRP